jgi:hypothetical protein
LTGASHDVTVAAIATGDGLIQNGMLYGWRGAHHLFGDRLVASRSYVSLAPGTNPDTFASHLQSQFITNGTEAFSIAALMDEAFSMTHQIFQLFQGYLAMGLLVGIAGIAVVMIRAVRERRRQIGTLRALGFPAQSVGRSFAIEAGYVAVQGTLIGVLLALLTLYTIIARSDAMGDVTFAVPVSAADGAAWREPCSLSLRRRLPLRCPPRGSVRPWPAHDGLSYFASSRQRRSLWPTATTGGSNDERNTRNVRTGVSGEVLRRLPGSRPQPRDDVLPHLRRDPDLDRPRRRRWRHELLVAGRRQQLELRGWGRRSPHLRSPADDRLQTEVPALVV